MKAHQKLLAKVMTLVVGLVLCGVPEYAQALPQQEGAVPQNGQQSQQNGTTVDPSKGPLTPVPTQNAPENQNPAPQPPDNSAQSLPSAPTQQKQEPQVQEPLGTATAEGVPTVGGAASRPAGEAIAPAKQKQRRSLLIKLGLIAAAGVAAGTVAALTKGTPSKPATTK